MRIAMTIAFVAMIACRALSQDAARDAKLLEGAWTPSAAELGGQRFPEAVLKTMKLVVEGDKYIVTVGDKIDRGTLKYDTSKKPREMDIFGGEGPNKGKTFLCIYELNGDILKVCYDLTGKSRPTEFKTSKDGGLVFLVTYKRAK